MRIATTETLATIVDSNSEQQPITATLESLEGIARWVLRCGGEDVQTGAFDTLADCLESARQSWESGDWQYVTTEAGAEVIGD
jgi:hypothetical protein